MKKYLLAAIVILFGHLATTLSSCKGDDGGDGPTTPKTLQDLAKEKMTAGTGTWPLTTVTIDGEDAASLFQNFSITFTNTSYSTTGTSPVWKANGTWSFLDEGATKFKRDDDVEVLIEFSNNDKTMKLTLDWNQTTTGRTESIPGKHVFILTRP